MAYDEGLAQRVSEALADRPGLVEKTMFGGVGYMLRGNMACGVLNQDLIVRVGKDRYEEALAAEHTRPFDITGRIMTGWVMVAPAGTEQDQALVEWVDQGVAFASSLPPK